MIEYVQQLILGGLGTAQKSSVFHKALRLRVAHCVALLMPGLVGLQQLRAFCGDAQQPLVRGLHRPGRSGHAPPCPAPPVSPSLALPCSALLYLPFASLPAT